MDFHWEKYFQMNEGEMSKAGLVCNWNKVRVERRKRGFCKEIHKKNAPLCNYGGVQVSWSYAEKYLLPDDEKYNYLVEPLEKLVVEWNYFT